MKQTNYRVYKYELNIFSSDEVHEIELPIGAEVLSVIKKCDGIFLYALVDADLIEVTCKRLFKVVGTGWDFTIDACDGLKYIGNVIFNNYEIYHVFEIIINNKKLFLD